MRVPIQIQRGVFRRTGAALLAVLVLSAAMLSGCGAGQTRTGDSSTKQATQSSAVTVHSAEELLEAVKPGAKIVVEPGTYNLSDYAHDVWEQDGENWNGSHEYVQLRDCYDGVEVVIQDVDGLTISGKSADTKQELVIDPRYGTVLTFYHCSSVKLENLTLGHTSGGECSGNVVNLEYTTDVELRSLDLYGCGEVGLECSDHTGGVAVYDSVIHDCSTGPLYLYDCGGAITFYDCTFTGSAGGGYYLKSNESEVSFYRCSFGVAESAVWAFDGDVYSEDCTWSGLEEDSEPADIVLNIDSLTEAAYEIDPYGETQWYGYQVLSAQTEESVAPPSGGDAASVCLILRGDGTGSLSGYLPETVPFYWTNDSENPAWYTLTTRGRGEYVLTLYQAEADSYPSVWAVVQTEDALIWLY